MLKSIYTLAPATLLALCLLSCSDSTTDPTPTPQPSIDAIDAGGTFTSRPAAIKRGDTSNDSITLRFYDDISGVPYVSVADFYSMMLPKEHISVSRQGDLYTITTSGGTATVDVLADRLTSSSFIGLFDMNSLSGTDVPSGISYDTAPYVKPTTNNLAPLASNADIDFKHYNIDLRDDGSNVFFPYTTLADIFSDQALRITYYNPVDNEVPINGIEDLNNTNRLDPNRIERVYSQQEVSDAMAAYRYNELCFVFDNLYGYPGYTNPMTQAGFEDYGFDATLDKVSGGSKVKQFLKSKQNIKFILGMDALQGLLYDGGHTSTTQSLNLKLIPEMDDQFLALAAQNPDVVSYYNDFEKNFFGKITFMQELQKQRTKLFGDKTYVLSPDNTTALMVFDSFIDMDLEGWNAYYASNKTEDDWKTLVARPKNMVASFAAGLQQARKDGVKNIILDITCNGGGSTDLAVAALSLMAKDQEQREKVTIYSDVVLTKQTMATEYLVDRNFDGKFDANDAKVDNSNFRFAVLTSHYSFSCANLMPAMMKDAGHTVIGEQSGGGACAIQTHFTPDGMQYRISTFRLRLTNKNRQSIDSGIPVDIAIPTESLYDLNLLSSKLNKQ